MKKLLILGSTCKGTIQMVERAQRQGIYTIVTDYIDPKDAPAKLLADEYWMINTADVDALEAKCREEKIDGVVNAISTFNAGITMELTRRLGLPCYATSEAWHYTVDKRSFKDLCKKVGVPVAEDYYVSDPPTQEELDAIRFPVVTKAIDLSANRGMSYCYNQEDVVKGCEYARSMSASKTVVVERMLKGTEYEAHYVLANGEASLYCFAPLLPQPGLLANCYGVTTTATNNLDRYLEEVDPYFKKLLKEAGCHEGIAWMEMMLDEDGHFYVLEMGYRLSGDLIEIAVEKSSGFDSFQWLVDVAMGVKHTAEDLPPSLVKLPEKHANTYILWSSNEGVVSRIEGAEEIAAIDGMYVHYDCHVGGKYRKHQYLMIFIFNTDDHEELISMVQKVNDTVRIYDENGENVALYYYDYDTIRNMALDGLAEGDAT